MSAVDELVPALQLPTFGPLSLRSPAAAPRASAAVEQRQRWESRYRRMLRLSDTVVVTLSCVLASALSLSATAPSILAEDPWLLVRIPLATAIVWLILLALVNTRAPSIMGVGSKEYARVAHATGVAFGVLAIVFVAFEWQGIRTQLFFALPVGTVLLLAARWLWRNWLIRQRADGRFSSRTVVVGNRDDVEYVISSLGASEHLGYLIVAASVLDADVAGFAVSGRRIPVGTDGESIARIAARYGADTILVASQPAGDSTYIKRLAWELEGTAAELVLSSRIADVAGPRTSLRSVEGLPLLHVRIPTFEGGAHVFKRTLDVVVSAIALLAFAPFALVIGIAIAIDDPGPVFFRQSRVGRDGRQFRMVKFRSMRVNAESELARLMSENEGAGPLFKLKSDPRVTRVGAILRKYSLDEVPQFWNVLVGDMSVVGPRPPLPAEVTEYDGTVSRRLYIKPGITGPWQVGGRSDLSWEESVRLDLSYVENWSVMSDVQIMWRTAKVMIKPSGAY
ncbi:sugar transferase [Microbacterium lacticum]